MSLGANTGGGGGGGSQINHGEPHRVFTAAGGNGGSGVVIISFPALFESANYTGIIPHDRWYHTF